MSRNTSEAATTAREQEQDTQSQSEQHAFSNAPEIAQPKPDVSDQDYTELLPKLLGHFHNNREELARAVGVHRSTVDRWLNNTSRPNNSTVLRMRRLAQERRIE
jgi:transcriptional regulator with XRE-family HTH domain